ncbi:MAG TPA: hypothetical protein VEH28_00420 [Thermoplasmata archaeon]|nr:hypothetical protein [Thermoplasmata archaeon]
MSDREETKLAIGLTLALFGPRSACQLETQAERETNPGRREFYLGAASIIREAANDPRAATDALESLWDTFVGKRSRTRKR